MTNKFSYEEEIGKFWKDNSIFEKVQEQNKGNKLFTHIDGPPFPTGDPHVGHIRNWAVKDSVLRFRRLQGYEVYARDGYDVHGLPVENKVQKKLSIETTQELREFGEENFIDECRKYVDEVIDTMTYARERFGLWMDRDYYHTSHPQYMSMAWQFFKIADQKGLLYKDYKTVAWCPKDETTLSDYEIKDEYTTMEDPSIYVAFQLKEPSTKYEEYLLIWTTTPWTLQSNLAIAVHPQIDYDRVLVEDEGEEKVFILAQSLVDDVISVLQKSRNIKKIKTLETIKGSDLEGEQYHHIYLEETPSQKQLLEENHPHLHSIILADFVTTGEEEDIFDKLNKKGYKHNSQESKDAPVSGDSEDTGSGDNESSETLDTASPGTGLVHIAPGHGFDDYNVGVKYNLPIFCPVNEQGKFSEGKYEGMYFKDVDPVAIEYLREKGSLLHAQTKTHRYPCCWRCKTPIVYRATDQWWIKRSELVEGIIEKNQNVGWTPEYARGNFNHLMRGAGDWAISRQRYWGIPIPIFEDEQGNYEVIGSKEELEEKTNTKLDDIHKDNIADLVITNSDSGLPMYHVGYTADVWFESGCASFASHYGEGLSLNEILDKYYPIKWITEGQDQLRGWFSSLFNVGYVMTGEAPYNEVSFQSFVMAKDGSKMSKSQGNGFTGLEAIDNWGADKTRYYLLSKRAPEDQINFDEDELAIVDSFFNTLENVVNFTNEYLGEYSVDSSSSLQLQSLSVEDKWILYRLNTTLRSFLWKADSYKMNQAYKIAEEFLVQDFSKTYLKLVKERCEERDEALIEIFRQVVKTTLLMLSSAIPFKTEQLYQRLSIPNKKESLFMERFENPDEFIIKKVGEMELDEYFDMAQDIVAATLNAREKVKIGVRWPLSEINIMTNNPQLQSHLEPFEKLIKSLANVSKINYNLDDVDLSYNVKPNFPQIKQDFSNPGDVIKTIMQNKQAIAEDLTSSLSKGEFEGVSIDYERHILKEIELSDDLVSADFKGGSIILHTHQDEVLLEQGYLRELIRRVQVVRKENNCDKKEVISLSFAGSDSYYQDLISHWEGFICRKVGADEILEKELSHTQEFDVKGVKLVVSFEKK